MRHSLKRMFTIQISVKRILATEQRATLSFFALIRAFGARVT